MVEHKLLAAQDKLLQRYRGQEAELVLKLQAEEDRRTAARQKQQRAAQMSRLKQEKQQLMDGLRAQMGDDKEVASPGSLPPLPAGSHFFADNAGWFVNPRSNANH